MLRPIDESDLERFKYDDKKCCENCGHDGSYRTLDFYLCKTCMFDSMFVEVEDEG